MAIQHRHEQEIKFYSTNLPHELSVSQGDGIDDSQSRRITDAHTAATAALCFCTFTNAWLNISVFPYAGFLAIELIPSADAENAGSYAGLVASSFMIGRALSSYGWGKVSDVYGRKFVLYSSLGLSALFALLFGISSSFRLALLWRFLMGLGNGMMGTAKTAVSEMAYGNEKLETRGMSLVMGMWGWGFLFAPVLSGMLAEPVRQYPDSEFVRLFEGSLARFPFILPNLVSVAFCLLAMAVVHWHVPETLPREKRKCPRELPSDALYWLMTRFCARLPLSMKSNSQESESIVDYGAVSVGSETNEKRVKTQRALQKDDGSVKEAHMTHIESCSMLSMAPPHSSGLSSEKQGFQSREVPPREEKEVTLSYFMSQRETRNLLILYWLYSFVSISVDEAFPLFCISQEAGLGLSEGSIGKILSGSGLIFAFAQYFVYSWVVNRFGLQRSIAIGALLSGPFIALVPFSLVLNNRTTADTVTPGVFIFLSLLLAVYRIFGLVFFSSITIATNRTVTPSHRGSMNGLSMLGGSIAKSIGPIFAGLLVSFSLASGIFAPHVGAVVIFAVIGLLGGSVAIMANLMDDGEVEQPVIELSI